MALVIAIILTVGCVECNRWTVSMDTCWTDWFADRVFTKEWAHGAECIFFRALVIDCDSPPLFCISHWHRGMHS